MVVRFCDDRRLGWKKIFYIRQTKGGFIVPRQDESPFSIRILPKDAFEFSFSSFRFRKGDSLTFSLERAVR